jgi:hypothetical protein
MRGVMEVNVRIGAARLCEAVRRETVEYSRRAATGAWLKGRWGTVVLNGHRLDGPKEMGAALATPT